MKKHPLNIFPEMNTDDFDRLHADLKANGFDRKQPITMYNGMVLDGWNRAKACEALGISPIIMEFDGTDTEALAYVLRTNKRRNMSSSQWAAIAAEAEDICKGIAERTERDRREKQAKTQASQPLSDKFLSDSPPKKNEHAEKTATKVAELFETNRTYVNNANKLKAEAPAIFDKVKRGDLSISEAVDLAKQPKEVQEKITNAVKNLEHEKAKGNLYKKAKAAIIAEERRSTMQSKALPDDIFQVIYCDPPWEYSNSGFAMSAEQQYPTMPTTEICAMPIKQLADTDAVIFMWATNPLLKDALQVMESWGFEYKTNLVWTKDMHTAGFYVFGQHELLLIGTKGKMLPTGTKPKSIITGNNAVHSKKPESVYEMIEAMYPGLKYVELFARNKRENWESWGNQV